MNLVLPLHPDDDGAHGHDFVPMVIASPLAEMERVASALAAGDSDAASAVLDRAGRRLQEVAVDELHRLAGQLISEVAAASTLREKVGRAIVYGTRLIDSRPAEHVLRQFNDPRGFVADCMATANALYTFLAATANAALVEEGIPPVRHPEVFVHDLVEQVCDALEATRVDGLDRRTELVNNFMAAIGVDHR